MLNWIKAQWEHIVIWWNRDRIANAFLEQAFTEAEAMGCRDSAEALERNCRMIWRRFGWWNYATSTATVRMHNDMFVVLGDRDRAAMVAMGTLGFGARWGHFEAPECFLPRVQKVLVSMAARGLTAGITDDTKRRLAELFPAIIQDLRMRDDGLPTVERVLIWIARGDEFRGWGCTAP